LKNVLKNSTEKKGKKTGNAASTPKPVEGLKEQKRKRRSSTEGDRPESAKKEGAGVQQETKLTTAPKATATPTRNFFAPLRDLEMEEAVEAKDEEEGPGNPQGNGKERPPPIITAQLNLLSFQVEIKAIKKGSFEICNTKNETRVVTKEMADYLAIKRYLEQKIPFYTFHPKSVKPIKAVIRHLPGSIPAEDIAKELQALGFSIISVRQMTSKRLQAPPNLPLFLVTLPRSDKSQEIFQLASLCHVIVKVEAYRAQTGLTQCHNCQQFGHVWANCKQPPKCVWCGGGHLHKECPEKENRDSTPACCNCKLTEGEKPHPSNYRGYKRAKEELQRRRTQKTQTKEPTGRVFSTRLTTPTVSFAEAVKGKRNNPPQQD